MHKGKNQGIKILAALVLSAGLLAGCAGLDAWKQTPDEPVQSLGPAPSAALLRTPSPAPTPAETVESCVSEMADSIRQGQESVMLYGAAKDVFEQAYAQIIQDPALFGISGCQYTTSTQGVSVVWNWNCADYQERLAASEAAAAEILSGIDPAASDYDKVRYVHDWLCQNVSYVFSDDHTDQNIYGALVERQAVCSGYCNAFQYLLGQMGIEAKVISGTDDTGESHAWNSVVLDGETYYCDVTWDDQEGDGGSYISYNWFCVTSEEMHRQHTPAAGSDMPDSAATAYNFYIYRGWQLDTWDEARLVEILSQQAGNPTLTVRCGDDATYQQMMDALFTQNDVMSVLQQAGISANTLHYSDEPVMRSLTFLIS
jgi:hypothetical protein